MVFTAIVVTKAPAMGTPSGGWALGTRVCAVLLGSTSHLGPQDVPTSAFAARHMSPEPVVFRAGSLHRRLRGLFGRLLRPHQRRDPHVSQHAGACAPERQRYSDLHHEQRRRNDDTGW